MRLKSFYATNATEAMQKVRQALGDDAIIIATHDNEEGGGVRVTAAIDDPSVTRPLTKVLQDNSGPGALDVIAQALVGHGLASILSEKLLAAATQYASDDPFLSLGAALDTHFKFHPLPDQPPVHIILVGPAGAGKTLCAAKMATKAIMATQAVQLISTDTQRAGAMAQLDAYARVLQTNILEIEDTGALETAVLMQKSQTYVIVDTAGCNPLDEKEASELKAIIKASKSLAVLVLPANLESSEAVDTARAFVALGASCLLPTRLDITQRLGGLLRVAYETKLPLCNFSASTKASQALEALNPVSLARLILPSKKSA
ncbi:MAG: GTPase [Alphaproteobacteria bacterium]|nr:GTPase [Alphaproteobacteria bacterium]